VEVAVMTAGRRSRSAFAASNALLSDALDEYDGVTGRAHDGLAL